jgi:hypothetical protein
MKSLVPANQREAYATEVFGVLNSKQHAYLPAKLLDAFRESKSIARLPSGRKPHTVWVAVDPASHMRSCMAMCAIVVTSATICIIGLATVSVARCEAVQVQQIINLFLTRVRGHPMVSRTSPIVPIIECNNNEV